MFFAQDSASPQAFKTLVAQEEYLNAIQRMQQAFTQTQQTFSKEEELYLLQQLQDLLGYEVSLELEGVRLTHSLGVMAALPHLKRFPADTLTEHGQYQEAGLSERRGAFGWFTELGQLTADLVKYEQYYVSVPAHLLPSWSEKTAEMKQWFKFRKVLVVNPFAARGVVAVIGDVGSQASPKYQFGGSPEVIREGAVWHLQSRGRVLVAFINDPENTVPLGPFDVRSVIQHRVAAESSHDLS